MRGWFLVVVIAVGTALVAHRGTVGAQGQVLCNGVPATIVGTGGTIRGTGGGDVIAADNGLAEVIVASGGDDLICAGEGDVVFAGSGADTILAIGAPEIYGESGNDFIQAATSLKTTTVVVRGGSGNDTLVDGLNATTSLFGEAGNDRLLLAGFCDGGSGADTAEACTTIVSVP
jgi:Ca2+-binding RTX toxin-like protein